MMFRSLLFVALLAVAQAQNVISPRVHWFGDIDATDLFKPPNDITNAAQAWGGPLDPPLQKPQSYRTYTVCYNPRTLVAAADFFGGLVENTMQITLAAPVDRPTTYQFKLEAPYLEIDPWQCGDAVTTAGVNDGGAAASGGNCRCNQGASVSLSNDGAAAASTQRGYIVSGSQLAQQTILAGVRNITVTIPNWTYFEHAPFPGQNPYMRTYRKFCMRQDGETTWKDTTVWIAVVHCCDNTNAGANTRCTDTATNTALSYSWNKATLTDPNIDGNWVCNSPGWLGEFFDFQAIPQPVSYARTLTDALVDQGSWDGNLCWGETKEMQLARHARTACCGARVSAANHVFGAFGAAGAAAFQQTGSRFGTCYNPQVEQCCGWKVYNPKQEKCCSKQYARINYADQFCKCDSLNVAGDCQRKGSNAFTTALDLRGEADALSTNERCCSESKYPDLASMRKWGFCYDSTNASSPYRCCSDGHIYDQGSQQCCSINGVQTLNTPCPCSTDAQCAVGQGCCLQQWPRSWTDGQGPAAVTTLTGGLQGHCDKYANWPIGYAPAEVQRCVGSCYDVRFQTCCNGQLCVREYERCCNSTCCNRFTSGCVEGSKAGSLGAGSRVNSNNFKVMYEVCTSTEVLTTRRAFWVWVMPTFWLVATCIALAIVTVVARRAVENVFDITERAMVFFAALLIGLAVPHYFSPTYKYGIVLAFVSLFAILGAVMRSKKMSLLVVVLVLVLLAYWLDPFEGNIFLSLTGGVSPAYNTNGAQQTTQVSQPTNYNYTSGIVEALFRLENNRTECTGFYDYFSFDPAVHDFARMYNPNKMTFGFCTRAWNSALLIFSVVSLAAVLILLLLSIFSFTKQLMPESFEEEGGFDLQPTPEYAM